MLIEIGTNAFCLRPVHQVLLEKSVRGYRAVEVDAICDGRDVFGPGPHGLPGVRCPRL